MMSVVSATVYSWWSTSPTTQYLPSAFNGMDPSTMYTYCPVNSFALSSMVWKASWPSAAMIVGWKCREMISSRTLAMPGWALLSRETVQPVQPCPSTQNTGGRCPVSVSASTSRTKGWNMPETPIPATVPVQMRTKSLRVSSIEGLSER